jgi:hypothetical protein
LRREEPNQRASIFKKKLPFLLAPQMFHIVRSVEERSTTRKEMPSLDQPPAEVRAHYKDASAKSRQLAALLRKNPQPHLVLGTRNKTSDALGLILPCQIIQAPGESPAIIPLDRLLDTAAASLDSVGEAITRAKRHSRPAKGPCMAQSEELRSLAASFLVKVFLDELGRPYHEHVAAIAQLLSGQTTNADYVKKAAKRSARLPVARGQNRPK